MKTKTSLAALAASAALLLAAVAVASPAALAQRPAVTTAERAAAETAAQAADAGAVVPAASLETYRASEAANLRAGNGEAQLQAVLKALRDYRAAFGQNPVGNNAEVAKALRGGNARAMRFADDETAALSKAGEALDRWGRPFYFHPISATVMEVRSAGEDGKMWTADDLVAR